jgi:hypothetical protein
VNFENIPVAVFIKNGDDNGDITADVVLQQCRHFISTVKANSSKCNIYAMMHSWWPIKSYTKMHLMGLIFSIYYP